MNSIKDIKIDIITRINKTQVAYNGKSITPETFDYLYDLPLDRLYCLYRVILFGIELYGSSDDDPEVCEVV
jgi:hypothetical protein